MSKRAWTEEELSILEITIQEKDLTYDELGRMFGRTRKAITSKAYVLRKQKNIKSNVWTKNELDWLKELVAKGYGSKKIADIMGRSTAAVLNKKRKCKIRYRNNLLPYKNKIQNLASKGMTYPEIAKQVELPRKTVYDFCRHYGIKTKKSAERGKEWKEWYREESNWRNGGLNDAEKH